MKILKFGTLMAVTHKNQFELYNNLSELHIIERELSSIEPGAFDKDLRLSTLILEFAHVTLNLMPDSFLYLSSLKSLIIKSGFIKINEANIFRHLKNLNHLQLKIKLTSDTIFTTAFLTGLECLKNLKIIDSDLRKINR